MFIFRITAFLLLAVASLLAQADVPAGSALLRGEIQASNSSSLYGLTVELAPTGGRGPVLRADVDRGGEFTVQHAPAGSYQARVLSSAGNLVQQEMVWIQDANRALVIHLRQNQTAAPFSGTVSAAQLQHHPPSGAVKEFRKGLEAMRRQDVPRAVTHVHKALELDPDYFDGRELLGVAHLTARRYEEAAVEFEIAARLNSESAAVHRNLALSLSHLNRFAEALRPARRAVRLAPTDPAAHWVLGSVLTATGATPEEALGHLRLAAEQFPQAHISMAQLLYRRGEREEAAEELQSYLHSRDNSRTAPDRKAVEDWLARLRQSAIPAP